jgi:Kelch motif
MSVARSGATATAIAGNRVLIAGGMTSGGGALREFEVVDASTNRVVRVGEMRQARIDHTATLLPGGRVPVLGGYDGGYLRTGEIFDPRTGSFTDAGSMNVGRSGHTATTLRDGTILIVGGVGDGWSFLSSAEVYDPRAATFAPVKPMAVARESHTATLLSDGRVLIAGGHRDRRENIVVYSSTELYDPAQRHFEPGPAMTIARHKHDGIAIGDGRVLVVGGSDPRDRTRFTDAEVYDPNTKRWMGVARGSLGRYKIRDTSIRLRDGRILIGGDGEFAEIFDPRTNAFERVNGSFGQGYAFASDVLVGDGDVLVLGGYDDSMHTTDGIWRFHQ